MNGSYLLFIALLWGNVSAFWWWENANNPTLQLVHVLFRHGDRNPDQGSILPESPYLNESYYPEGYGQLTNAGKVKEYAIGEALKTRYSDFLTTKWNINYLDPRSTDVNRTKMSLELMLGALYPPRENQIWSLLFWQPIPYTYYPTSEDKETQAWIACSGLWELFNNITSSPEMVEYLKRYEDLFILLGHHLGTTATIRDAYAYYFGFATQTELGYTLETWTSAVYPEPIHSAAVDFYYIMTNTTALRRIVAGHLLKKILEDTDAKINGTLSPADRKMFIYSAHELNVATFLLSLEAFKVVDIPPYGSYVLVEVHKVDDEWGIKLFYQNYENEDPVPLKLKGCDYLCPYDYFKTLVNNVIATDEDCPAS